MSQLAPNEIHRFMTAYVVPEDRLRFSCTLVTGDTDVFWLTQRLAGALTKTLLDWLDKTIGQDRFRDIAQRMAQQSAVATKPKAPPLAIPAAPGWLVHGIEFKTTDKLMMLTFKDAAGADRLLLRFDPEHLRRWMKVLHTQYRRSGWPMDMWPDWMGEDSEAEANAEPGLLH